MQMNTRQRSLLFFSAILMFSCAMSGCVELKYTALNRLNDPIAITPSRAVQSVYFSFPAAKPPDRQYCEFFSAAFAAALREKGFVAVDTPSKADIVIESRAAFYKKAQGTFLFVLILPTYRFNEDYDGILMNITYRIDKSRWHKKYRAYYRGWLDGDIDIASDLIIKAILADLPFPVVSKGG